MGSRGKAPGIRQFGHHRLRGAPRHVHHHARPGLFRTQPAGDHEGGDHRERAEHHAPGRLSQQHADRTVAGAERHERDRAQRRPPPVEQGGQQRVAEVVERGVGHEQRAHPQEPGHGERAEQVDQRRRGAGGGKQRHHLVLQGGQQRPHSQHAAQHQQQRGAQGFAHPAAQPGPQVLRHDRPDRAGQGVDEGERDRGDAVDRRLAGHRLQAEPGQGVGGVGRPHRGGEVGQDRRHRHRPHQAGVRQQPGGDRPVQQPVPLHAEEAQQRGAAARHDGGDRSTHQPQVQPGAEAQDQQRVEPGGDRRTPQRHRHGAARIPQRPQQGGEPHAQRDQRQAGRDDAHVARHRVEGIAGGAEPGQDRAQQQHGGQADQQHHRRHHQQGGGRDTSRLLEPVGADQPRHRGAQPDRHADRDRDLQHADRAGEADRRGQAAVAEARDVEQVEQVDREHRDQPDRAGAGHHRGVAHDRAGAEPRPAPTIPGLDRQGSRRRSLHPRIPDTIPVLLHRAPPDQGFRRAGGSACDATPAGSRGRSPAP